MDKHARRAAPRQMAERADAQTPKLSIASVGNGSFVLSWPATASSYGLESAAKLEGRIACGDVIDPNTGEVLIESGTTISKTTAQVLADANLGDIHVLVDTKDPLILNSLQEDATTDHESALLRIYQRLRPGNPPQLEKARELFHEKFFDTNRYRLGKVGRFRINRKFSQSIAEDSGCTGSR